MKIDKIDYTIKKNQLNNWTISMVYNVLGLIVFNVIMLCKIRANILIISNKHC